MKGPYCATARRDLLDFVRNRLKGSEQQALAEHLEGCAECRALEQRERALDGTLARLPARPASAALKQRLVADSAVSKSSRSKRFARPLAALALAAAVLGILFWFGPGRPNSDLLVAEAVNDHLRVLYANHAIEIESGGIHQVKPWFEGRLDFAPVLDFAGDDEFALAGGAVGYFIDRKAAVFIFKRRLHIVTLFVFRADGLPWPRVSNRTFGQVKGDFNRARGFNTFIYRDGDLGYAMVSDVDTETMQRFAAKVAGK